MPKVLFAWELGAGYGHVAHLRPVMAAFAAAGWEQAVAGREPALLQVEGVASLLAPRAPHAPSGRPPVNLSAILLEWGYGSPATLGRAVDAWRRLFAETGTDLVCAEYAPTALLAARLANLPAIAFGMGFFMPPLAAPLPSLTPWLQLREDDLATPEAAALASVNAVCAQAGAPPLARFADLWAAGPRFVCTWPELDHYEPRTEETYSGPLPPAGPPSTPSGRPRAFVYLRGGEPRLPGLLAAFAATNLELTGHLRGLPDAQVEALSGPGRRFSATALDPVEAIADAHFVVTNGGHGLVSQALRAGRPLLLLPTQAEQAVLSLRLARRGLAFTVDPRRPAPDFTVPLRKLAGGALAEAAQAFARSRAGHDPARLAREIAAVAGRLVSAAGIE